MSALNRLAVSPETVRKFAPPTPPPHVEMERRIEELEKKVRRLAKQTEAIEGLRRHVAHLNGFMLTVNHVCGGKAKHSKTKQIEDIIRFVAGEMNVETEMVLQYRRKEPEVREARKIAMWVAYQFRPYVIRDIARAFCRKDHGTVWHAIRSLDDKQVAKAQKLLDDYRRIHHAEAETTTGRVGATSEGEGLAGKDERPVSGTDGERST